MKKFSRNMLSVIIVLIILVSAVGCSNNAKDKKDTSTDKSTSTNKEVKESKKEDVADEPVTIDCFINHSWYWTDVWEGIIPEEITKNTNVKLNITRALDGNQLGLMIASNDLPEMIFTAGELDRLSNDKLCYSYNELIEKYAPDWKPNSLRIANAKKFSNSDKYYTILQNFNSSEEWKSSNGVLMTASLGYRGDLYKELGSPDLNNLQDLENILTKVKEKYPDLIPLGFNKNWQLNVFKIWTGVSNLEFKEMPDNTLKHVITTDKYYEFLKLMNSWVRKGFIMPDNFTLAIGDTNALAQNGKVFAYSMCTQGELYRYGNMAKSVAPDATLLECKPLGDYSYYNPNIGWSGTFITKNNKHPEEAIKFMRYMFSDEGQKLSQWGREGEEWTLQDNGTPKFSADWVEASKDDSIFYKKYNPAFFFGTSAVTESEGRIASLPQEYHDTYAEIRKRTEICPWFTYAMPQNGEDEKIILDKVRDMITNTEVKIILSTTDEEFETNYKEMLSNADKIGINKLEKYITTKVTEAKEIYK